MVGDARAFEPSFHQMIIDRGDLQDFRYEVGPDTFVVRAHDDPIPGPIVLILDNDSRLRICPGVEVTEDTLRSILPEDLQKDARLSASFWNSLSWDLRFVPAIDSDRMVQVRRVIDDHFASQSGGRPLTQPPQPSFPAGPDLSSCQTYLDGTNTRAVVRGMDWPDVEPVRIAVIDDSFYLNHVEWRDQVRVVHDPGGQAKGGNHGTMVTGVLASALGRTGIDGIAPNAELYLFSSETTVDILDALYVATQVYRVHIVVLARTMSYDNACVHAHIRQAQDTLFVVAAGNLGVDLSDAGREAPQSFPSQWPGLDNVISVAALDGDQLWGTQVEGGMSEATALLLTAGERPVGSNYGKGVVDIGAPGDRILSTGVGEEDYRCRSATSMATPQVAGVAAVLMSLYLTGGHRKRCARAVQEVKERLLDRHHPLEALAGKLTAPGRVDTKKAVDGWKAYLSDLDDDLPRDCLR